MKRYFFFLPIPVSNSMDGHTSLAMFQRFHGIEIGIESNRCEINEEDTGTEKSIEVYLKQKSKKGQKSVVKHVRKIVTRPLLNREHCRPETRKDGRISESQQRQKRCAGAYLASNNMRPKH